MSQILQKLREVDPNDSDAVKGIVTTFFQTLPKHTIVNCNTWLRVLEDVITRFPRYCSQHRTTIENYLVHFLDSSNYYNVIAAAKCAHGLQQIRPSQDKIATPKNCWREQMIILCNTAHTLIEAVFSKTVSIYKNNKNVKNKVGELLANTPLTLALSRILNVKKHGSEDKQTTLCVKLRNIFVFIQALLVEVYPVAKPVQPQLILEVIVQALSVSSSVTTDVSEAVTVKIEALRTLDALIVCLGPNLIPFSGLVFRFVMQTLRWSSDNPSEESRKVRIAAYKSLGQWLSILHVHRVASDGRKSWEDELTTHLIDDITPPKKIVQFNMSTDYVKKLSKKARRKLANSQLLESKLASHMPGEKNKTNVTAESNDEVANAALECIETFFTVCGVFLKPTTHKLFQERLVRECYSLESYCTQRAFLLLQALDAARKNTPPGTPPPTQYCVQLYSTLVNSRCDQIRKFSSQALLDIRLHLHHSPPTLTYSLALESKEDKRTKQKKEISKRNRDALEALLGREQVNVAVISEDATSTPEDEDNNEPFNKKQRLDDDAVMIDISSESEGSVIISDDSEDDIQEITEENEVGEQNEVAEQNEIAEQNEVSEQNEIADDETEVLPVQEDTVDGNSADLVIETDKENVDSTSEQDIDQNDPKIGNIHDEKTQIPLNISNDDTIEGDKSPVSMEIAYDIPNTGTKVTVMEKMDDENLPSTNDTDDVQITCGQTIVSPQDVESKDNVEVAIEISTADSALSNGISEHNEQVNDKVVRNGEKGDVNENIEVKITSKEVTVEDMLADFVDEVNEEPSLVA